MSIGSCLCGSVSWETSGKAKHTYHCHCSMCRKAHGAAFGTYALFTRNDFAWTSDHATIVTYESSPGLTRAFCGTCGSVVPAAEDDNELMFVPAGCHDEGITVDSHIFVDSKAPWYDISDDLPRHDAYPPGEDHAVYPDKALPAPTPGVVRGSCLCGAVEFQVLEPLNPVYNCFCSRCRRARAAPHTTNGFTTAGGLRFVKGEEYLARYKAPDARYFTHVFCSTCGSGLPRVDQGRNIAVIPLGALDDDPGCRATANIFVGSKADWYEICDDLTAFDEGPGG